jgi:hypothetical protein
MRENDEQKGKKKYIYIGKTHTHHTQSFDMSQNEIKNMD